MANKAIILGSLLIITILVVKLSMTSTSSEGFDATGLVYNQYPSWFHKQAYDPRQWLVRTYPDAIESSCMPYARSAKFGSLENINYLSNASRFWRF